MTLEDLEKEYENKEEDERWFYLQAVLGSKKDADRAWDSEGKFHCIDWFDCRYCPALNEEHCM